MTQRPEAYINAIDGLRALAVLSVLAFHLSPAYLPGGFVGVDIFFAISGYVVCTAALSKPADSFWTFCSAFYARRVRRIMPALLAMLLVTSLLSALLVPEAWLSQANKRTGFAAFFGLSNFVLGSFSGDYFSPRAEYNPFTHTWSLAIEEQFYLLFAPLLFLACMAHSTAWRRRGLTLMVGLLAGSLALCAFWTHVSPVWAFYGSPARFWEMWVGVLACLAAPVISPVLRRIPKGAAQLLGMMSLVSLVAVLCLADPHQFPWPWALWPVVATSALMLLFTARDDMLVGMWLSGAVARWVGQRSYSLYLWHWPVYVLMRWTCGLETPLQHAIALALSVGLAMTSYRWIEQPVRQSSVLRKWPDGRVVLGGALATLCIACVTAVLFKAQSHVSLSVTSNKQEWFPEFVPELGDGLGLCGVKRSVLSLAEGELERLEPVRCEGPSSARHVFVLGDSHAGAYFAMMAELVQTSGDAVTLMRMNGCPVFNLMETNASHAPDCAAFAIKAVEHVRITARPGDVLFLPSLRLHRLVDQWTIPVGSAQQRLTKEPPTDRQAAVVEAVNALRPLAQRGVMVVLEAPKPLVTAPAFRCSDWFNRLNPVCRWGPQVPRESMEHYRRHALTAIHEVAGALPSTRVWDPLPHLCDATQCGSFKSGRPVIFDGDHLTGHANHLLLGPFRAAIAAKPPAEDWRAGVPIQ